MYILAVIVLLTGSDEPTLTTHVLKNEALCVSAANIIQEQVTKADTVFSIVACNPIAFVD